MILERFLDRVSPEPNTGCWLWMGATGRYGRVRHNGKERLAHQVSWELHRGPLQAGSVLRHRCDTPPCVNPDHLIPGTQAENMGDMRSRGRSSRGSGRPLSKLTEEAVREMRERYAGGGVTFAQLAKEAGVHRTVTWRAVRGGGWGHVRAHNALRRDP